MMSLPLIWRHKRLFCIFCFRDIAAAINRKEKYSFDEMIYVVSTPKLSFFACCFMPITDEE